MADLSELQSWHSEAWRGLKTVVLGLGVSGFSVADTLVELGSEVTVVDARPDEDRAKLVQVIGGRVETPETEALPESLEDADLVVASPGLPPSHPWLQRAAGLGVPVWGDIELAWRVRDKVRAADWLLVTGTNGKTTTTQLAAHMLREGGFRVAPVGNIGTPVLDAVRDPEGFDVLVVELSSFQLHTMGEIWPHSAAVLNIADDHLDWHGSADAYRAAKAKAYENVRVAAVYNTADRATEELLQEADVVEGARAIGFGLGIPGPSDFGLVEGVLVDRAFLDNRHNSALELATLDDLGEAGLATPHMTQNALAAAALARAYGAAPQAIRDAIRSFRPDAHRTQHIAVVDGVSYVDDSKATNPHAAGGSLRAFPHVVWIVGGLLKGVAIGPLVAEHASRLRAAVVIGADRAEVLEQLQRHAPGVPVEQVLAVETEDVMREAVTKASAVATSGDTVLLAPAAASMDQFKSYADRGDRFQAAVEELKAGRGGADERDDPNRLD
ncbi:UDP-N-acetylmuramoyl-L-alanine--D-glutamate ligase [Agrococcus casei]|uniref:UDP-N-acetylmuramoyl-L-alanine--D-glutamate ligase n=1 Tax=Agrococcus casei TaxID=343512 RepID=UPI003F8E968F